MICENCNKEFFEDWRKYPKGKPRFCSKGCSNARHHSKETIEKIRNGVYEYMEKNGVKQLEKELNKKYCEKCGKVLDKRNKSGYCKKCIEQKKELNKKYCKKCNNLLSRRNKTGFCYSCFNRNNGKNGEEKNKEKYIKEWLEQGELESNSRPRTRIRNYLLKQQNYRCDICGMEQKWNGKDLVFILDHINGHSDDNRRENLRMVCPNCDSQLPTYKNKNKGNGRKYDREYYHKIKNLGG